MWLYLLKYKLFFHLSLIMLTPFLVHFRYTIIQNLMDLNLQLNILKLFALKLEYQNCFFGKLLKNSGIPFYQVYSSQWCRCLKTAELLNLGPVIEEPGLNSFFQGIVNQEETLTRLREKMKEIQTAGERVIMVTH